MSCVPKESEILNRIVMHQTEENMNILNIFLFSEKSCI